MSQRRIEYISIDEVVPATFNPKKHSPEIARSILRFDFTMPLLVDERTGNLVAGHGRLEALQALRESGRDAPQGVTADWQVPVIRGWSSANDNEARAYLVADNQLTITDGWENDDLLSLLTSLDDLDGVGFTLEDLDRLAIENAKAAQDAEKSGASVNFDIVVECDSSLHREEVMSFLTTEGLKVRER